VLGRAHEQGLEVQRALHDQAELLAGAGGRLAERFNGAVTTLIEEIGESTELLKNRSVALEDATLTQAGALADAGDRAVNRFRESTEALVERIRAASEMAATRSSALEDATLAQAEALAAASDRGVARFAEACRNLLAEIDSAGERTADRGAARWLWTGACVMLWIHVACAFQFQHRWSQAAAYAHTARQTAEFFGLNWGGGLYFNYLLMLVLTGDAAWWSIGPHSYGDRPAIVGRLVGGFVAFMAFNATVVFGAGPLRWLALGVILVLGAWAIRRRRGA
jgi:hypothetical protein